MTAAGESVVVVDDLSTGYEDRVPEGVELVVGSVLDRGLLDKVMAGHGVGGVVHIAAKKAVGESVERPLYYYEQNVEGLRTLLAASVAAGVRRFVFSSSAAVYGAATDDPLTEETLCRPVSPYGETKTAGEWLVRDIAQAHDMGYVNLRYFNVAGADAPELVDAGVFNVIPMIFKRLSEGRPPAIFGDDYNTPDGTCVRDYIHVGDIAAAHLAAARRLSSESTGGSDVRLTLNAGRGEGVSVRELVDTILDVTGHRDVVPEITPRRPGDPDRSVAAADRIAAELGWRATRDVREMVASAWAGWQHLHG